MNLPSRRWLALSFGIIFIILAPLLIAYSLGYSINFSKGGLEKTGVFFIKSYPRSAEIWLDGEKQRQITPNQITRLIPKTYQVEIKKDAYRPWQKNLPVYSQQTTFIQDVSLFYEKFDFIKLASSTYTNFLISPDNNKIALLNAVDSQLDIVDLSSGQIYYTYSGKNKSVLLPLSWSFSSQKLLFKENNNWLISNMVPNAKPIVINSYFKTTINQVILDSQNDNLAYVVTGKQVYQVDLMTYKLSKLPLANVDNILSSSRGLYVETKINNQYFVDLYAEKTVTNLLNLGSAANYSLSQAEEQTLILLNYQLNKLLIFDFSNKKLPLIASIDHVLGYSWRYRQLLYWNSSELWVDYPDTKQSILLERTSQKIANGLWHPNAAYAFAIIGDQLKVYELDSRDQRNIYNFFNLPASHVNQTVATDNKGNYLYIINPAGLEPGLYQVKIQ